VIGLNASAWDAVVLRPTEVATNGAPCRPCIAGWPTTWLDGAHIHAFEYAFRCANIVRGVWYLKWQHGSSFSIPVLARCSNASVALQKPPGCTGKEVTLQACSMRGLKIARLVPIRMLSSALTGKRLSRSLIMPGHVDHSGAISLDDAVRVTPAVLSILLQPNKLPA
jgi:hypothetical protein